MNKEEEESVGQVETKNDIKAKGRVGFYSILKLPLSPFSLFIFQFINPLHYPRSFNYLLNYELKKL